MTSVLHELLLQVLVARALLGCVPIGQPQGVLPGVGQHLQVPDQILVEKDDDPVVFLLLELHVFDVLNHKVNFFREFPLFLYFFYVALDAIQLLLFLGTFLKLTVFLAFDVLKLALHLIGFVALQLNAIPGGEEDHLLHRFGAL